MSLPYLELERVVISECKKTRTQVLQQIEIKMVDNFQEKGLGDFMHTNFAANTAGENVNAGASDQAQQERTESIKKAIEDWESKKAKRRHNGGPI